MGAGGFEKWTGSIRILQRNDESVKRECYDLCVLYKYTMNYKNVQERVGDVMGGKDLDWPEVELQKKLKKAKDSIKREKQRNDALKKENEELKAQLAAKS